MLGCRAPRWRLLLHPPARAAALAHMCKQSIASVAGVTAVAVHSNETVVCCALAGQMSATLPDRVVLMKQDSARVAHVDVRVALSKSLPKSSDAGRYDLHRNSMSVLTHSGSCVSVQSSTARGSSACLSAAWGVL